MKNRYIITTIALVITGLFLGACDRESITTTQEEPKAVEIQTADLPGEITLAAWTHDLLLMKGETDSVTYSVRIKKGGTAVIAIDPSTVKVYTAADAQKMIEFRGLDGARYSGLLPLEGRKFVIYRVDAKAPVIVMTNEASEPVALATTAPAATAPAGEATKADTGAPAKTDAAPAKTDAAPEATPAPVTTTTVEVKNETSAAPAVEVTKPAPKEGFVEGLKGAFVKK